MIHAFTVSRANTPSRAQALLSTLTVGRDTAKADFVWTLYTERGTLAANIGESALATRVIDCLVLWDDNKGQHVAFNEAHKRAKEAGAQFLLRIDDDVQWLTKRWLAKLLEVNEAFEGKAIISPTVQGLKFPPERSEVVEVAGIPVEFLTEAIGGVCRLHPLPVIEGYVSDVRHPLGAGDAVGMGRWCRENILPMVWAKTVRIRHDTKWQEKDDPKHFQQHSVWQHIPYIPRWSPCE